MMIKAIEKIRIIWLGVGLGMTLFEIAFAITCLSKGRFIEAIALLISVVSLDMSMYCLYKRR